MKRSNDSACRKLPARYDDAAPREQPERAHLYMMMRGVEKQSSQTITSALRGVFRDDGRTRDKLLRLVHLPRESRR